jgi:hypothetical protein
LKVVFALLTARKGACTTLTSSTLQVSSAQRTSSRLERLDLPVGELERGTGCRGNVAGSLDEAYHLHDEASQGDEETESAVCEDLEMPPHPSTSFWGNATARVSVSDTQREHEAAPQSSLAALANACATRWRARQGMQGLCRAGRHADPARYRATLLISGVALPAKPHVEP